MLLLNYTHPLTEEQVQQITQMIGVEPQVRAVPVQIDQAQPLAPQVVALADAVGLSPQEWQTTPLLVNPPGLAAAASMLLAEMHGRMGYFPTIVRIRPVAGSTPVVYEVAELLNLQAIRDQAREGRQR